MTMQEMSTAAQYDLPIKIFILNNEYMGMVRQWQELLHGGRYSETDLSDNPDFVQLAAVFGIPGQMINHANQVDDAITALVNSTGPYIVHACIDDKENVWPLVPPGAANDEMMTESAK